MIYPKDLTLIKKTPRGIKIYVIGQYSYPALDIFTVMTSDIHTRGIK
jgi:hypothetical protein